MGLRAKFSLLLSGCALLSVFFSTWAQTRAFTSDQQAYLSDFQSSIAQFIERQLTTRMAVLYSRGESAVAEIASATALSDLSNENPLIRLAQVWENGALLAAAPTNASGGDAPLVGLGKWTLTKSPSRAGESSIRWLGRYGGKTLVLDMDAGWLEEVLESSHGATSQLIGHDGSVLASSEGDKLALGRVTQKMLEGVAGLTQTERIEIKGSGTHLITSVKVATEPPFVISVSTPWRSIQEVVGETYRRSAWTAIFFLLTAIAIGSWLARDLTSPLQLLADQTKEVARGNFEAITNVSSGRTDEVGRLAHAFNHMGLELRRTREELLRSERLAALGSFSSSIAHEIKNPLSSILGNAQLAKRAMGGDERDKATADTAMDFVVEETKRANRIINQLMKFSRRDQPPTTRIDLSEKIAHFLAIMRPSLRDQGVELETNIQETPLFCLADADQIHEVLANLVQNGAYALKDMATKKIKVTLGQIGEEALLTVSDAGVGMPDEVKAHLFEPFYTTKPVGQGTGLGLSVCHGIIAKHLGTIEVESERGKGTTFRIHLPLASDVAAAA